MEDRRQEVKKRNKIEERRRILQTDLPPIHKKNYEDDLFLFYSSQNGLASQRGSVDNGSSNPTGLPPINRSASLVEQTEIEEFIEIRKKQEAVISAWRAKAKLPAVNEDAKPMKLLNYMNKYLERRKSQASLAFSSFSSMKSE